MSTGPEKESRRLEHTFLERLIDTAQAIILILDPQGRIELFNPYMEDISGYALEEVRGKSWFATFLPEADRDEIEALFAKAVASYEVRGNINPIVTKSGERRAIEWYGKTLTNAAGEVTGVLSVGHDVTERLQIENELRSREARLQSLIASTHEVVVFFERGGTVTEINPAAETVFGCEAADIVGKPLTDLLPAVDVDTLVTDDNEATATWGRARAAKARSASGDEFPFGFSITRLGVDDEYALVGRDSSENIALQNQLLERERLAAIGTTAATFAHEIGNPLNSISINLQVLRRRLRGAASEAATSSLERCESEVKRLTQLLNEFRSLSRRQRYDMVELEPGALLESVVAIHRASFEDAGVDIELNIPPSLPPLLVDSAKMTQVILNMCKNANEAMPEGGTLSLSAHRVGDAVELWIEDTGHGMPEGVDVFEPFVTTKETGTGLGLAVVKQVLSAHRGTVRFQPRAERGTRAILSLPTSDSPIARGAPRARPDSAVILVVDDDASTRSALEELLGDEGYRVQTASNGEEAVSIIATDRPDLIISDLRMPRMSGEQLLDHVRAEATGVPTIIMTSKLVIDAQREAARLGAVDFINKPIDIDDVFARVRRTLDRARS